jgi:NTP pyrophosphatase (non-canonical NTP hydrolase)
MELTFSDHQKNVDQWVRTYGVRYFDEMTNLGILMEEVGEVARLMVRVFGEQSFKKAPSLGGQNELADELADVFFVLTCIANQTGIDLTQAIEKNMEKKTQRDNCRHWENPKLNSKS